MKCFSCGADKDTDAEAIYPYIEDNLTTEVPIPELLIIECQGDKSDDFRMVVMCHECWHRLERTRGIDMWIGQGCWKSLVPMVSFDNLPLVKEGDAKWDAWSYEV